MGVYIENNSEYMTGYLYLWRGDTDVQSFRVPLHHRTVLAVKAEQLGERGEPDIPSNVVATRPPHDHEVMKPIVSIEEGENEASLAATLSD